MLNNDIIFFGANRCGSLNIIMAGCAEISLNQNYLFPEVMLKGCFAKTQQFLIFMCKPHGWMMDALMSLGLDRG
jgi:hypothetical protein